MDEQIEVRGNCPDLDNVSAYYDSELTSDLSDKEHIETCPKCAARIDAYKILDEKIKARISTDIPEDLAERVKLAVFDRLKEERKKPTLNFPMYMFRAAATIAVCALISFVVFNALRGDRKTPIKNTAENTATEDKVGDELASIKRTHDLTQHGAGGVSLSDLAEVSATFEGDHKPLNLKPQMGQNPVRIPNRVRQVWIVKNLESVFNQLQNFARKNSIPKNKIKITQSDGKRVKLNLRLSKRQLVKLVKQCAGVGAELLTPENPQPDQNLFVGNGATPVQYNADFVLNE